MQPNAAANHDALRVENVQQVGDADPQIATRERKLIQRKIVAGGRRLLQQPRCHGFDIAVNPLQDDALCSCRKRARSPRKVRPRSETLQCADFCAPFMFTREVDGDMANFCRQTLAAQKQTLAAITPPPMPVLTVM